MLLHSPFSIARRDDECILYERYPAAVHRSEVGELSLPRMSGVVVKSCTLGVASLHVEGRRISGRSVESVTIMTLLERHHPQTLFGTFADERASKIPENQSDAIEAAIDRRGRDAFDDICRDSAVVHDVVMEHFWPCPAIAPCTCKRLEIQVYKH